MSLIGYNVCNIGGLVMVFNCLVDLCSVGLRVRGCLKVEDLLVYSLV